MILRHSVPLLLLLSSLVSAQIKPGNQVCAPWGGSPYLATITAISNGQAEVIYADGDRATLPSAELREIPWDPQLETGNRVLASWNNSARLYPGTVLEVAQLSYKVQWEDGSAPSWVPATRILKRR